MQITDNVKIHKTLLAVSVVIPSYNRAGFIAETLMSLFLQTYANYEVILVDDASTDNAEYRAGKRLRNGV